MDLGKFEQDLALEVNKAIMRDVKEDPTARLLNIDRITEDDVKEFLHQIGATTWGVFTVYNSPGDELAAKWFLSQLGRFYEFNARRSSGSLEHSSSR